MDTVCENLGDGAGQKQQVVHVVAEGSKVLHAFGKVAGLKLTTGPIKAEGACVHGAGRDMKGKSTGERNQKSLDDSSLVLRRRGPLRRLEISSNSG